MAVITAGSMSAARPARCWFRDVRYLNNLKRTMALNLLEKMLDKWVCERHIRIDFSRPRTPTDNATVESFNGRLRQSV
jgi:hypothetical protein